MKEASKLQSLITCSIPLSFHVESDEENFKTIKGKPRNKSPSPNEFTSEFFAAAWGLLVVWSPLQLENFSHPRGF